MTPDDAFSFLPTRDTELNPPLLGTGAWAGHIPFVYDLIYASKPKRILELGVDRGESLLAFSAACRQFAPNCKIVGIDSWEGDPHAGTSSIHLFESLQSDIDRLQFSNTRLR